MSVAAAASVMVSMLTSAASAASAASASSASLGATVTPFGPRATQSTVTLVTGETVTVSRGGTGGPAVYAVRPGAGADGVVQWQTGRDADRFMVPAEAMPFLGRGLDASLFDVSALARRAASGAGQVPVTLAFAAGSVPVAPPGVTLTSVSGTGAQGFVSAASAGAFAQGLRARIGGDVAAGLRPGSTPLVPGLVSMGVTGAVVPVPVTPAYPLHNLQVNVVDAAGGPAGEAFVLVINNDSVTRKVSLVPVVGGVGRVAVPAGDYTVESSEVTFDAQGKVVALRAVSKLDVAVPDAGSAATDLDMRSATSQVSVATPLASRNDNTDIDLDRIDATGNDGVSFGLGTYSPTVPLLLAPTTAPLVGSLHMHAKFIRVSADPAAGYRYDLAYRADHVDADQSYSVTAAQLATLHHHISGDPAVVSAAASLLTGATDADAALFGVHESSGLTFPAAPGTLTGYVAIPAGSQLYESVFGYNAYVLAQPFTPVAGASYTIDWLHGPLAPTQGVHHGNRLDDTFCAMCAAGSTVTFGYQYTSGDSAPDHMGAQFPNTHLTGYVGGRQVVDADGYQGMTVQAPAGPGPTTYRVVLTTDSGGDPMVSQSTNTVTDLTVVDAGGGPKMTALTCPGQSATSPCRLLPALNLTYHLASDLSNTSGSSQQSMTLEVGHISYNGQGSDARIKSAGVQVSFDGGLTWQTACVTGGAHGRFTASWSNPGSAAGTSPMLRVTATDSVGGAITQTITHAYTIAAASTAAH